MIYLSNCYSYYFFIIIPVSLKILYLKFWKKNNKLIKDFIKDPILEYYNLNKNRFIKSFEDSKNYNTNIDSIFYNKDEYNKLMQILNNDLEKKWKTKILFESTPRGNILMFYDTYKQSFCYYCDSNSSPYYILNAVAMKYVLIFYCRDFFLDNKITENYVDSPFISIYSIEEKKKENINKKLLYTSKDSPFIKSKKYGSQPILKNLQDIKMKPSIWNNIFIFMKNNYSNFYLYKFFINIKTYLLRTLFSEKSMPINTEIPILMEKEKEKEKEKEYNFNRFTYYGKINNFNILKTLPKIQNLNGFSSSLLENINNETKLQKQVMNYKDYKLENYKNK